MKNEKIIESFKEVLSKSDSDALTIKRIVDKLVNNCNKKDLGLQTSLQKLYPSIKNKRIRQVEKQKVKAQNELNERISDFEKQIQRLKNHD
jgi:F0F1-type ATP synthase membrane subunit b/b'